jgi:vacuolar-type H+-ATPase subunit I/STV1
MYTSQCVCMCMYGVCSLHFACISICIYIYIYIYIYMYVCVNVCLYVCIFACVLMYIDVCACMHLCVCMYLNHAIVRRSVAEGSTANDLNEYNALRSTLLAVRRHNQKYAHHKPERMIHTCVCPSFPVLPTRSISQCIQQMKLAFENTVLKKPLPAALVGRLSNISHCLYLSNTLVSLCLSLSLSMCVCQSVGLYLSRCRSVVSVVSVVSVFFFFFFFCLSVFVCLAHSLTSGFSSLV